jgi:hypothetical protein
MWSFPPAAPSFMAPVYADLPLAGIRIPQAVEDWARTLDDRDTAFLSGGFTMTSADEDRGMAARL